MKIIRFIFLAIRELAHGAIWAAGGSIESWLRPLAKESPQAVGSALSHLTITAVIVGLLAACLLMQLLLVWVEVRSSSGKAKRSARGRRKRRGKR